MIHSPGTIEYLFSEVPETENPDLEHMYYNFQRQYIALAYNVSRDIPEHPAREDALKCLCAAFNETMEALFRLYESPLDRVDQSPLD